MENTQLREGDILRGIHGHIVQIIDNDSFRYLASPNNKSDGHYPGANLLSWNYRYDGWKLDDTVVVDRILEKYNNL